MNRTVDVVNRSTPFVCLSIYLYIHTYIHTYICDVLNYSGVDGSVKQPVHVSLTHKYNPALFTSISLGKLFIVQPWQPQHPCHLTA